LRRAPGPAREVDGLIFVFPGNAALANARRPRSVESDARYGRRLNCEVACHYTFMHENLFDRPPVPAPQPDGHDQGDVSGRRQGEDWCEVDYTFWRARPAASRSAKRRS
jgi:phenylpropionate dioxygenase-like ring-hydroxylating dioxygenase large terminal subunit